MTRAPLSTGPSWFGSAYARMMRGDPHAPGSIDRALLTQALGVESRSAPTLYSPRTRPIIRYRRGSRPRLETTVQSLVRDPIAHEATVRTIARFTSELARRAPRRLVDLRFGGREEAILARGSDWCADVARVAAGLLQVAGIPSRIVLLADLSRAYSGHTVIEAYRDRAWGCVDSRTGVVYSDPHGRPATTWDLLSHPSWVSREYDGDTAPYSRPPQFGRCAIAPYDLVPRGAAAYRTSRINAYYRSILQMSARGWPGGLRWLHGEDRRPARPERGARGRRPGAPTVAG